MSEPRFNLLLLGYRNDIARGRVLDFLRALPYSQAKSAAIGPDTKLPARLFENLAAAEGQQLRTDLEGLGAQTALVPVAAPAAAAPIAAAAPAARAGVRVLGVGAILAGVVVLFLSRTWQPAAGPHARAPFDVPAPAFTVDELAGQLLHAGDETDVDAMQRNTAAVRLAETGDFERAVSELEKALSRHPENLVLLRNRQTILMNWGIRELSQGRMDEARVHLEEAADLGKRGDVLQALGLTYLEQGERDAARQTLEDALRVEPAQANTMLALARIYVEDERRADALALLERAKETGARGNDLDMMIDRLSREVDAEWDFVETRSSHFRLSFADEEDMDTVDLVLDALEGAYEDVGAKFDLYPDARTAVVLYTREDFHTATGTPDWAGAAYDGRIKLPVGGLRAANANLDRMVRHEYAHRLIALLAGDRCPLWLNEGLAVWAEEIHDGERLPWAREVMAGRQPVSFTDLSRPLRSPAQEEVHAAYAQSYLTVREMVDRYGDHDVAELLTRLGRGERLGDVFADLYREDLALFYDRVLWQLESTG
jgi:tetratricopeptide (TPR) repeat protein